MKRSAVLLLSLAMLTSACSLLPFSQDELAQREAAARLAAARKPAESEFASDGTRRVRHDGVEIVKVAFRPGVSSVTVENLAKRQACVGGQGAGLVSDAGPVEIYRMACDDGRTFMARCELRQCAPLGKK